MSATNCQSTLHPAVAPIVKFMRSPKSLEFTTSSMAPSAPRLIVPIDLKKKPWEQKLPLHNRWHPQIPPVAEVMAGEYIRVEMVDANGGNIKDDNSSLDVKLIDSSSVSI